VRFINNLVIGQVFDNWRKCDSITIKTKKEGEMPPVFKALATITTWVLFVLGWIFVLPSIIFAAPTFGVAPPHWGFYAGTAVGAVCFISAVVAMKLRQMLE